MSHNFKVDDYAFQIYERLGTSQRLASRWTKSLPEKFLGFTKMPIE